MSDINICSKCKGEGCPSCDNKGFIDLNEYLKVPKEYGDKHEISMKLEGDDLIFSSGKKVYANHGIIGISPELKISEGYDGDIEDKDFTCAEKLELADYAIKLWQDWAKQK